MSGGKWGYCQNRLEEVASDLEELDIAEAMGDPDDEEEWSRRLSGHRRMAINLCRRAAVAIQRWDWLLSGDDGPESFISRWDNDMRALHAREKISGSGGDK